MNTRIAIGFSQAPDVQQASYQASLALKNQLGAQIDLIILLACPAYATAEALGIVHSVLQPQRLVGSSTAGILLSEGVFNQGLALLGINSADLTFGAAATRQNANNDLHANGFELGRKINADVKTHERQTCLMFTDYALQSNTHFVRGAQEVLGSGFPMVGALSSDDFKFKRIHQFYQKQLLNQSAVGLLIGGANVAISSKHGFKPLGKPRTITKADSNVIRTIDHKPAMHIYEEFLGPEAEGLRKGFFCPYSITYPLGIYIQEQGQYLLKNAVDILPDGSILCQGEIPQDTEVHIMIGNKESCLNSAAQAAAQIKEDLDGRQASLIIVIESVARHRILKNASYSEIQIIKEVLGSTTPLIGMYTFGEVAPLGRGSTIHNTHMQNESIVILAIE